jgi:hypothetical protein
LDNFLSTYEEEEEEEEGNRSFIEKRSHWTNLTTQETNTLFFTFFCLSASSKLLRPKLVKTELDNRKKQRKTAAGDGAGG